MALRATIWHKRRRSLLQDVWTRCYDETLELYLGLAECEYLVGNFDSAIGCSS